MVSLTAFLNEQWGTTECGKTGQRFALTSGCTAKGSTVAAYESWGTPSRDSDGLRTVRRIGSNGNHACVYVYIYNGDDHYR